MALQHPLAELEQQVQLLQTSLLWKRLPALASR
jgi:hypothetical protein